VLRFDRASSANTRYWKTADQRDGNRDADAKNIRGRILPFADLEKPNRAFQADLLDEAGTDTLPCVATDVSSFQAWYSWT